MIKESLKYLFFSLLIFHISCNSSLDGKIEKRQRKCGKVEESHSVYLVNASSNKKLRFTIKKTETINDTIINYVTFQEELEPGDEYELGCDKIIGESKFKSLNLALQFDTIIHVKNQYSGETKYYCTKDTSLLKYSFDYEVIFDDKHIVDKSWLKQSLLENKQISLKEFLPESKLFIGIKDNILTMNENLTRQNGKLTATLNCIDLNSKLKSDIYKYKFEVTGQIESTDKKSKKDE